MQPRSLALGTHISITQRVTVSPCARHAAGSLSFFLHSRKALFSFPQRTAICLDVDINTADVGGPLLASASAMAQRPCPLASRR